MPSIEPRRGAECVAAAIRRLTGRRRPEWLRVVDAGWTRRVVSRRARCWGPERPADDERDPLAERALLAVLAEREAVDREAAPGRDAGAVRRVAGPTERDLVGVRGALAPRAEVVARRTFGAVRRRGFDGGVRRLTALRR